VYIIDLFSRLLKSQNWGILAYLVLNILFFTAICSGFFQSVPGAIEGLVLYAVSLALALSPLGEWILRLQTGCRPLKRKEHRERLMPLFEEVYAKVREANPAISGKVQLFLNNDQVPNAFATGRRTICLTKGFLGLTDDQIRGTLAHEFAHLTHKDTDLILLVTVGNCIMSAFFIVLRAAFYLGSVLSSVASRSVGSLIGGLLIDTLLVFVMGLWTKLGTLLVMHSSRQGEYLADEFAFRHGYGEGLASALDTMAQGPSPKGLWAHLLSSHPETDARIGKLQDLGVSYRMA